VIGSRPERSAHCRRSVLSGKSMVLRLLSRRSGVIGRAVSCGTDIGADADRDSSLEILVSSEVLAGLIACDGPKRAPWRGLLGSIHWADDFDFDSVFILVGMHVRQFFRSVLDAALVSYGREAIG